MLGQYFAHNDRFILFYIAIIKVTEVMKMDWITEIQKGIDYIEDHIMEELDYSMIAKVAYSSNFHFQRIFSILCGFTVGEYIRYRRLSLAGKELFETNSKIIDIALKYGYDTPESFTKAFTRFHNVTPTAARKSDVKLKYFERLLIQINKKGGEIMDYKIDKKDEFELIKNQIFDSLQVVRKYPRTFLGSTSRTGIHHMIYEILTCSLNEATDGYCTNIDVKLKSNDIIEISDNGRGIPTAIDRKTGISILESLFTSIHDRNEETTISMFSDNFTPVGLGIINALSELLEVEVCDGKNIKYIKFERGIKTTDICIIGTTDYTGTTIRFKADPEIFDDVTFDYNEIHSKIETQVSLHEKVTINLIDQRTHNGKYL